MATETTETNPLLAFLYDFGVPIARDLYSIIDNERRLKFQQEQQAYANDFAERQFQETKDINAYNRYLSENGVQIRVNDLARAGLSKVLASGSTPSYVSASTGGSVSASSFGQAFKSNALMEAMQMKKNFQKADAEIEFLKSQKDKVNAEKLNVEKQSRSIDLANEHQEIVNDYDRYHSQYWQDANSVPDSNTWVKLIKEALGQKNLTSQAAENIASNAKDFFGTFSKIFDFIRKADVKATQQTLQFISKALKVDINRARHFFNWVKNNRASSEELVELYTKNH